jgi:hypothetical protein
VQILGDVQPHIEPHQISQAQRTHRMVIAEFHSSVDVARAGHSLLNHAHRFEPQRDAQAARSKPRDVSYGDGLFPHLLGHRADSANGRCAGLLTDDYFDQPHDMHRIEKVHADDPFRIRQAAGNLSN